MVDLQLQHDAVVSPFCDIEEREKEIVKEKDTGKIYARAVSCP